MHSSKAIHRSLFAATTFCCFSFMAADVRSDATTLSAPDGRKKTSRFDLGEQKQFSAEFQLIGVAQDTGDWAPMAAVGLEDRHSKFTVLLYLSQPDGPDTAWVAGMKYLEDGTVLNRVELGTLSTDAKIHWRIAVDSSGLVSYEVVGAPQADLEHTSGTISTRITDPQGIRIASGLEGSFAIN